MEDHKVDFVDMPPGRSEPIIESTQTAPKEDSLESGDKDLEVLNKPAAPKPCLEEPCVSSGNSGENCFKSSENHQEIGFGNNNISELGISGFHKNGGVDELVDSGGSQNHRFLVTLDELDKMSSVSEMDCVQPMKDIQPIEDLELMKHNEKEDLGEDLAEDSNLVIDESEGDSMLANPSEERIINCEGSTDVTVLACDEKSTPDRETRTSFSECIDKEGTDTTIADLHCPDATAESRKPISLIVSNLRKDIESPMSPDHPVVLDNSFSVPEIPFNSVLRTPDRNTPDLHRSSPASPVDTVGCSLESPIRIPNECDNAVVVYFPMFEKTSDATGQSDLKGSDHSYSVSERVEIDDKDDKWPNVCRSGITSIAVERKISISEGDSIRITKEKETPSETSMSVVEPASRRDQRLKRENRYFTRRLSEPEVDSKMDISKENISKEISYDISKGNIKEISNEISKSCVSKLKERRGSDHDYSAKKVNDAYCWTCHFGSNVIGCQSCLRAYHLRCLPADWKQPELTQCPECSTAEESYMSRHSKGDVYKGFCFAISRIGSIVGYDNLTKVVEAAFTTNLQNLLVNKITFRNIEERIEDHYYQNSKMFLNDFHWVYHNMHILELKYELKLAKLILKTAKQESVEIETCLECYLRANTRQDDWFIEPCQRPHLLVWARLKGYPYWPAKAMRQADERVDVRFFGAHDRAWVPARDIFLYSRDIPLPATKNKRSQNLDECIDEIEMHIVKLKKRFGGFTYHPNKAKYQADLWEKNLLKMLPNYKPSGTKRPRQNSANETSPPPSVKKRKSSLSVPIPIPISPPIAFVAEPEIVKVAAAKEVPVPSLVPGASPAVTSEGCDVRKSPEAKEEAPSNPPLKIKVKLNSGKRGFATITPDRSPARDEAKAEKKKKKRQKTGESEKRTDTEESESESRRLENLTETESNPSAPQTPSISDVPPPFTVTTKSPVPLLNGPVTTETEPVNPPLQEKAVAVLDDEIQKLMDGRKSISLVPKSALTLLPPKTADVPAKIKRTARKSFPVGPVSGPKPLVEEILPENITIKPEPVDYIETPSIVPAEEPVPIPIPLPVPKPKAALPALRAIRPSNPVIAPSTVRPAFPPIQRMVVVRPGLTVRMVGPSQATVRAPVVLPPQMSTIEPMNGVVDPLAIREIAKRESDRIAATLQLSVESMLSELANQGNPYAQMAKMKVEIHNLKRSFQDQLDAAKKSADLKLNDVKNKLLAEKERALASSRAAMQLDKKKAIDETKKKQWCAQCGSEAFMYCCWNTSYCTYRCQQAHWPDHLKTCASTAKDKAPVPLPPSNNNPMSLIVASQSMTQNTFQTTVSVPQPITVAFGGPLANGNPAMNQNQVGAQKILLLSNGAGANGQFFLRGPTSLTVRPVVGHGK